MHACFFQSSAYTIDVFFAKGGVHGLLLIRWAAIICLEKTWKGRHTVAGPHPCLAQVMDMDPGADSSFLWNEVSLLRVCAHPRIVKVFGVTLSVGVWCPRPVMRLICLARCCKFLSYPLAPPPCSFPSHCTAGSEAKAPHMPMASPDHPHFAASILAMFTLALLSHACPARLCCPTWLQDEVLVVAMQLMDGGSLRDALQDPRQREQLRWGARCACGVEVGV